MNSQENTSNHSISTAVATKFAVLTRGRIERLVPAIPILQRNGWMRGECEVRNETILLPQENQYFYSLTAEEIPFEIDPLFAFLHLDLKKASEVCDFVARYGLLTEAGLNEGQESLEMWSTLRLRFLACMTIYSAIGEILTREGGSVDGFHTLYNISLFALESAYTLLSQQSTDVKNLGRLYIEAVEQKCFGSREVTRPTNLQCYNLVVSAYSLLAHELSELTQFVTFGFSFDYIPWDEKMSSTHLQTVGLLTSGAVAVDLRDYLSVQLGYFMQEAKEARLCSCGCGRFFVPTRADQRFFSPTCSTQLRVRKCRQKKSTQEAKGLREGEGISTGSGQSNASSIPAA